MAIYYFELDGHGTPCNLGRTLRAFGQQVKLVDVHQASTLPADLDEVHGVVVCGGGASVTASSGAVESFVRAAAKADMPEVRMTVYSERAARSASA
jgi:phosphoribosylformylglycinamidine (FGAM) synthase-like amidotransferase family enzyme